MKPKTFFEYLSDHLKAFTISAKKIFGDEVYIVPTFPAQQISSFGSPACFIMDTGATPSPFNPLVLEQGFSVGFWLENVDRTGDTCIRYFLEIEESLIADLRALQTLNSEKVLIMETGKKAFAVTPNNYPCLSRAWSFSVILTT